MFVTRRGILAGGLAATALPAFAQFAQAQGKQINVFAHRVLQNVSNGTKGGDVTQGFTKQTGGTVNWVTFETGPLHDRLFREASLGEFDGGCGVHPEHLCDASCRKPLPAP